MPNSTNYSAIYQHKTNKKSLASSRLAKKEEKNIGKQTLYYLLFGVLALLLFIFIIVPNLIRFFFAMIDKDSPFVDKDTVPPQVPTLSSVPVEATFSASLNLRGFAEPKSRVIFLIDSMQAAEVMTDDNGQFEHQLALADGPNEVAIFGVDEAGNESLKTKSYLIARDSTAPTIEIEEPKDGSTIELKKNRTVNIKGKTEPEAKVMINDRLVLADQEGNFSSNYYLAEGKNELNFVATDKATNKTELKIEVEFKL